MQADGTYFNPLTSSDVAVCGGGCVSWTAHAVHFLKAEPCQLCKQHITA